MAEAQDQLPPLEMEAWSGFLRVHSLLHRELDRRLIDGQRMTLSTYEVLLRLAWAGSSGLRMSELAQQVLMTSGGFTRLADRLEAARLIVRTRCDEDLRGYMISITPAGRKALRRANHQHLADVRELFLDHVTPTELEVLAAVWRRLKEANPSAVEIIQPGGAASYHPPKLTLAASESVDERV